MFINIQYLYKGYNFTKKFKTIHMKKLLLLGAAAMVLVANLSSCKKGENDPFLSLKSRKARLCGEWTVTKSEGTSSYATGIALTSNSTVTTYNGTTETSITTGVLGAGNPNVSSYTQSYTFVKDGTFTMVFTSGTDVDTYEGNWMFLGKNKNADLAKKEAVMLSITKQTSSSNGTSVTESFTGYNNTTYTFLLDELKSKQITMIDESTNVDGAITSTNKTTTTLTAK